MGLLEILKKMIPDEVIDGGNVVETAEIVDLDIAHKLLVVEHCVPEEEAELFHNPPSVTSNIKKRPDGTYQISWKTEDGPDFKIISENEAKIMRARFLLLKGFYTRNWNRLTLPKQNEIASAYEIHWIPPIGMFDQALKGE